MTMSAGPMPFPYKPRDSGMGYGNDEAPCNVAVDEVALSGNDETAVNSQSYGGGGVLGVQI